MTNNMLIWPFTKKKKQVVMKNYKFGWKLWKNKCLTKGKGSKIYVFVIGLQLHIGINTYVYNQNWACTFHCEGWLENACDIFVLGGKVNIFLGITYDWWHNSAVKLFFLTLYFYFLSNTVDCWLSKEWDRCESVDA